MVWSFATLQSGDGIQFAKMVMPHLEGSQLIVCICLHDLSQTVRIKGWRVVDAARGLCNEFVLTTTCDTCVVFWSGGLPPEGLAISAWTLVELRCDATVLDAIAETAKGQVPLVPGTWELWWEVSWSWFKRLNVDSTWFYHPTCLLTHLCMQKNHEESRACLHSLRHHCANKRDATHTDTHRHRPWLSVFRFAGGGLRPRGVFVGTLETVICGMTEPKDNLLRFELLMMMAHAFEIRTVMTVAVSWSY